VTKTFDGTTPRFLGYLAAKIIPPRPPPFLGPFFYPLPILRLSSCTYSTRGVRPPVPPKKPLRSVGFFFQAGFLRTSSNPSSELLPPPSTCFFFFITKWNPPPHSVFLFSLRRLLPSFFRSPPGRQWGISFSACLFSCLVSNKIRAFGVPPSGTLVFCFPSQQSWTFVFNLPTNRVTVYAPGWRASFHQGLESFPPLSLVLEARARVLRDVKGVFPFTSSLFFSFFP